MKFLLALTFIFHVHFSHAQNYQALHGSSYAGSLAPAQNPSSIVHVPFPWDVTIFALQAKHSTNAFKIEGLSFFSLLAPPDSVVATGINGIRKHFLYGNQDVHLLNARINLSPRSAIAFGANVKNYFTAESGSKTNFQDTIMFLSDFMRINLDQQPLSANALGSAWAEFYASFAHTIADDGARVINAGVTLKATRALAGARASTSGLQFSRTSNSTVSNNEFYTITGGNLQYGYSSNFDRIDSLQSAQANRKAFLKNTNTGFSADAGVEYIMLAAEELDNYGTYAYETKIGLSVMDIGKSKFSYGTRSRNARDIRPGVTDTLLENRLYDASGIDDFNDSLAGIFRSFDVQQGSFAINQPTRVVLNVDQHVMENFFVNAEVSIPLTRKSEGGFSSLRALNFIAVTPRWELKSLGLYLPLLLNNRNQFWVGGAVKAGPLLMGTHNLANLFSRNKIQRGGFYLAMTLRPGAKNDRQQYIQGRKPGKQELKGISCPKF